MDVNPNYFQCDELGENTVTLTVFDQNEDESTCTATVTVVDIEGFLFVPLLPLSCPSNQTVPNDEGECSADVEFITPAVSDGCGEVTLQNRYRSREQGEDPGPWTSWSMDAGTVLPVGRWQVQWRGTDEDNNRDRCSYIVTVEDTEAPESRFVLNNTVCLGPYPEGEFFLRGSVRPWKVQEITVVTLLASAAMVLAAKI